MAEHRLSTISRADSLEKMGEFGGARDFAQLDSDAPDIEFTTSTTVSIESGLLAAVEKQARLRGIAVETLVNLWLQEKLAEQAPLTSQRRVSQTSSYQERINKIRQRYPRAYEKWTDEEDMQLKREYHSGKTIMELAALLDRQPGAIESRLRKLGLTV